MPDQAGVPAQEMPRWQSSVTEGMYEQRIRQATRAIQTGVHWRNGFTRDTEAALSVRVTAAMADHAALAELLMAKGVFTRAEYLRVVAEHREAEAQALQEWIGQRQGRAVDLYEP